MKKMRLILMMASSFFAFACNTTPSGKTPMVISSQTLKGSIDELTALYPEAPATMIERGVRQVAALWQAEDGSAEDFRTFCKTHFAASPQAREKLFLSLSRNFELIFGHNNQVSLELNKPLHLDWGELQEVDLIFAAYAPSAHLTDDLFRNKVAFITILNFPFFSLEEKTAQAPNWSRQDWAYARMGDLFISRVPAAISQEISRISTESDSYISEYNIMMDRLIDSEGNTLFPAGMKLITHWGLRDEIKSNYGNPDGLPKQQMVYQVMKRIIAQDIPQEVINDATYLWNPVSNEVFEGDRKIAFRSEPDTRYQQLLNNFHAHRQVDAYSPNYPTYIQRAFDQGLELSRAQVEALFEEMVSSPVLRDVGSLISQRLGRDLQPFDIWYDGFKMRSALSEEMLNTTTRQKYPDALAFEKDMPAILMKLGYDKQRAQRIAEKIKVEASRGAGHAWGAQMRSQYSYLRTRIASDGMDYKGYNIAVHELGHNVEQTITLHDVDYYLMNGVPNTAFTEALAFIFQVRDLELLGMEVNDPLADHYRALDNLWGSYEIMGVSLVDMAVWEWMYANPNATAAQLKAQTIQIATAVWNKYFAPVFGVSDQPILAIYSHMISYPLYLSAYPLGHLIEFQIEQAVKGKNLASEIDRIFTAGRYIPQYWMEKAVGGPISGQPMLDAAAFALQKVQ